MNLINFFKNIGIKQGNNVIVHGSFRKLKKQFPNLLMEDFFIDLMEHITKSGSIILPTFTYCYKRKDNNFERYDIKNSESKVGALSEFFRKLDSVVRTSSPTHSFALWGKIKKEIPSSNSPESPLGAGSVLEWLSNNDNSYVLLLGTDFTSLSFCHYLEIISQVPWADISPWDYLGVEPYGVSINNEQKLKELPGCSKPFINFQNYLLKKNLIKNLNNTTLETYYISIELLLEQGLYFFTNHLDELLCPEKTCQACDTRRLKLIS